MTTELARRAALAQREIGRSVVAVVTRADAKGNAIPFGVKDTNAIPRELIARLEASGRFAWLTIDKMADKGRSIDTDLTNPITYRLMTGSTSGGPINILKGLTELAVGTDGGGSVLGPAAASNLTSFIGAGLDVAAGNDRSVSTDGIAFTPSIGIIGKSVRAVADAFSVACGISLIEAATPLRVALPRAGDVRLPDEMDMREKLDRFLSRLPPSSCSFKDFDLTGIGERSDGVRRLTAAFAAGFDIVLTAEGPVDVFGYDETILRSFSGPVGPLLTGKGGKFLIKAANIAHSSAATVPTDEPASALLVCGKPGISGARAALSLAAALEAVVPPAPLFKRYFLDQEKKNEFLGREC
jgi:hypothetical protein